MRYLVNSARKRGKERMKEGRYLMETEKAGIQNGLFGIKVLTISVYDIFISLWKRTQTLLIGHRARDPLHSGVADREPFACISDNLLTDSVSSA